MRVSSGVPLPTPMSGGCRYYDRLATGATWNVSNRKVHEDLGVPFFADHTALTESFASNLADVGNPIERQLGRYLR